MINLHLLFEFLLTFIFLFNAVTAGLLANLVNKWVTDDGFVSKSALPPDAGLNLFQYLLYHNYTYENHTIITEDGYILKAFRLPCPQHQQTCDMTERPPVLMVHGIWCNPMDFILRGPKHSPGFIAVDGGYDVWLLANRGNSLHSTHHTTYKDGSFQYYDFSFHEIGVYDVPASIDYITNATGKRNVSFVGHSQGGTAYFPFATGRPEYNSRIPVALLYAPVVSMANAKFPFFKVLIKSLPFLEALYRTKLFKAVLPYSELVTILGLTFCNRDSPVKNVCLYINAFLAGFNTGETKPDTINKLLSNDPCGGSYKSLLHYIQIAKSDKFQQFDQGNKENLKIYGSPEPPAYNLSHGTAPIVVFSVQHDNFIEPKDLKKVTGQLPNHIPHVIPGKRFNHVDFVVGKHVYEYVSRPTLIYLDRFNKNRITR